MSDFEQPLIRRPSPKQTPLQQQPSFIGQCERCGAPLQAHLYFCGVCGQAFRTVESVTGHFHAYNLIGGEAIRKKVPQVWNLFWAIAAALFLGFIISIPLKMSDSEEYSILWMFITEGLLLGVTLFYAIRYRRDLKGQFSLKFLAHSWFWIGLGLLAVMLGVNFGWHWGMEKILGGEGVGEDPDFIGKFGTPLSVLLICIFPAVLEELCFRGLLQPWLTVALKPRSAIVLASALFAAMHVSIISFPVLFLVGLLLGVVHYKTRMLLPCIILHFLHNLIVIFVF